MRKELVLFFLLFVSAVAFAQKQTVTGTVTDVTKEPMIGATIIEVGNPSNGTIADINGHFSLSIEQGGSVEVIDSEPKFSHWKLSLYKVLN